MSYQFIEVSPRDVILDCSEVERDDGLVYEHLKCYCSKFTPHPAITVKLPAGRLLAVRGHKYLSIALELRHERIRAVIHDTTFEALRRQGVPGAPSVVPHTQLECEQNTEVIASWHVFFFKSIPSRDIADQIDARFRDFLNQSLPDALGRSHRVVIDSDFDFTGPCFEIKFPTPVANHAWARLYHAFISSVSKEMLPIASYQGRRFAT
ncbi:MAG: hypothetical protein J2P21_31075 [Chloracidobacterium sp.]|nr:hypothetical protein [Chloracidobacterium sp.]